MSLRLYFLLPDVPTAQQVEKELLLARIESRRMHFMARDGVDLGDLPEADFTQKSDFIHAMGTGLVAGGSAGAIVGLVAMMYLGFNAANSAILGLAGMFGSVFGAWVSGLIGISIPNSRLKMFEHNIEHGQVLLMLDVPRERKAEITGMVRKHHPESDFKGAEPSFPAFP
ncbi:MAG: DUF1269 domain-containing protein [Chromatiales bacterium]|jgi:hypothetical protein